MLVLTRQIDEEIVIDDNIRVKVISISGGQVRLGIEAPQSIPVFRRELYDEICRQNRDAAQVSPSGLRALMDKRSEALDAGP